MSKKNEIRIAPTSLSMDIVVFKKNAKGEIYYHYAEGNIPEFYGYTKEKIVGEKLDKVLGIENYKRITITATTEECLDVIRNAKFLMNYEPQLKALIEYFPHCFKLSKVSISGKVRTSLSLLFTFEHKYFPNFEQIQVSFFKSGFSVNLLHLKNNVWEVRYAVRNTSKHYVSIADQEKLWENIFEKIIKMEDRL